MSFVVAAALAIALLVAIPVAAHLLRRGRAEEREFPPARLVPKTPPVARQRSRLEDRALLSIRGLMIAALALLGATPLVRCSRLNLARQSGASVALAIVLDDSLSMRATMPSGGTRFERAQRAARELLGSAREGDAIAIVLAGSSARLALAATTDLSAAESALGALRPTDRGTDLVGAVQVARSALQQLPHIDKRVVLLSDLAGDPIPSGEPVAWAPIAELSAPVDNCGIASAEQGGRSVTVTVGCTTASAARDRELAVTTGEATDAGNSKAGEVVGRAKLAVRSGVQTVTLDLEVELTGLDVKLDGEDALAHDDVAPVAPRSGGLLVAAITDPTSSSVTTGGATVIDQALAALGADAVIRPLPVLPDEPKELANLAAIVLDDPAGITPESRLALSAWLERGGVALALLGPGIEAAKLGSTLEPFVRGDASWQSAQAARGVDPKSAVWLGEAGASLAELGATGRVALDTAAPNGSRIALRWNDGSAFLLETPIGRGLALVSSLPASVDVSDFALRPGFLALLDHTLAQAARRSGPPRSPAGVTWLFAAGTRVEIQGPDGALQTEEQRGPNEGGVAQKVAVPELRGRYRVRADENETLRIVTIDAEELSRRAREPDAAGAVVAEGATESRVDASREIALVLLLLLSAELGLRAFGRFRKRRRMERANQDGDDLRRAA